MTTKPTISPTQTLANGNGKAAPTKRQLTTEEHLQKANRLMEKAWDMIYQENQRARKNQESDA